MPRARRVIAVGVDAGQRLPELLNTLKSHGYRPVAIPTVDELLPTLGRHVDAVIVVYNPQGQDAAHRLLRELAKQGIERPVIVLVDRSDFEQYYDLMCAGAFDYFELDGDPAWLEHALHCAEDRLAA